jgi:uncharacterized protein YggE
VPEPTGVTVTGIGRVAVRPDLLVARLGAEVSATSVQAALDGCSAAAARIAAALREAGVADADLATSGASVHQAFGDRGQPRGWTATQGLTARLRDLGSAGEAVSAALAAAGDAARLYDLSFSVDDDREARRDARRRAFADAAETAALYAEQAGRRLGVVRAVREGEPTGGGRVREMRAMAFGGGAADLPVEPGSQDVAVAVEVTWDFIG